MADNDKGQSGSQQSDPKGSQSKGGDATRCEYNGEYYAQGSLRCDKDTMKLVKCQNGAWVPTDEPCPPA